VARRAVKNKRLAKYIHPADKWIALRTKLREARFRDGIVRAKIFDFMHKALPAYTAEHPSKYSVVEEDSDRPVDVPAAVTPKNDSRNANDVDYAETIDLRELAQHHVSGISSTVSGKKERHL
jgi:hypothetical protein